MNVTLLQFLGEVQRARHLNSDLATSSLMDPLDLQLAISVALNRGFLQKPNGRFELTGAAHEWIRDQLGSVLYAVMHMHIPPPPYMEQVDTSLGDGPLLVDVSRSNYINIPNLISLSGLPKVYEYVAYSFKEMWLNIPVTGESAIRAVKAKLHPLVWNTLTIILIQEAGMVEAERVLNLPARSAKVLLKVGLDQVDGMPGMGKPYLGNDHKAAKFTRRSGNKRN